MIKYFYGIIAFFGAVTFTAFNNTENISEDTKQNIVKVDTIKRDILLEAIIVVESNGNDSCIGDRNLGRPSVGCLQIRPIMVREVNRLLRKQKINKKYTLNDRYSRKKSIEMFYIWKDYHHSEDSDEVIARCWNGGPKGWKKKSTNYYWAKVVKEKYWLKIENEIGQL
ncbi:lytic transglycosylase domain-containing protein [bacterium]|nr:lytic transglycosylase domain-containing protein [bacterium]